MTEKEIESKVRAIVAQCLELEGREISMDASLKSDFGADSLDMALIVLKLERTFGISIDDNRAVSVETIRDMVSEIKVLMEGRQ